LLTGQSRYSLLKDLSVCVSPTELAELQSSVEQVYVSAALLNYLQDIIDFTRQSEHYPCGLSPRAGLSLLAAAKAWAFLGQRQAVLPEDIQAVLPAVAGHRLRAGSQDSAAIVAPILQEVSVV
jgi:MoxR-like ATPase